MSKGQRNCDSCINLVYDEDFGYDICVVNMDEDEFSRYAGKTDVSCPFYQFDDEYINIRKQN